MSDRSVEPPDASGSPIILKTGENMSSPPTPKKSVKKSLSKLIQRREREREVYHHFQNLGICITCHKTPAEEGSVRCADCNELRKKKYFQPRTEETSSKREFGYNKRNEIVFDKLKENKIMFRQLERSLFQTSGGIKFYITSVAMHRTGTEIGTTFRVRNERKIEFDYWVGVLNEDIIYVFPNRETKCVIYFKLSDMDKFKNRFELLKGKK